MPDDPAGFNCWTDDLIRQRVVLSTVALAPIGALGASHIAQIRQVGITQIEISGMHPLTFYDFRDRDQVAQIAAECRRNGVSVVSVQSPPVPYGAPYDEIRTAAAKIAAQALHAATSLGAEFFVMPFTKAETNGYHATITELLDHLQDTPLELVVQSRRNDLDACLAFVDEFACEKLSLDLNMARITDPDGLNPFCTKGRTAPTLTRCQRHLRNLHVHDFKGGLNWPLFESGIQWDELFSAITDIGYENRIVFGLPGHSDEALTAIGSFARAFLERYGTT